MKINARRPPIVQCATIAASLFILTACGGGGGGSASVGGTVTGLANGRTLSLQNNGADTFTITGNSATSFTFAFATPLGSGDAYSATVSTQPLGQTCVVTQGSGSVNSSASAVTTILVTCSTTASIVGTVTGLLPGVALTLVSNNVSGSAGNTTPSTGTVSVVANGNFQIPGVLAGGSTYTVGVSQQPRGQTCTVGNPTGTIVTGVSSTVTVVCN